MGRTSGATLGLTWMMLATAAWAATPARPAGPASGTLPVNPASGGAAAARGGTPAARGGETLRLQSVTMHVFHRVFPNFHDRVEVRLRREFRIGDSEYTGTLIQFVPDFDMDIKTHKVRSKSQQPNNPAFHIVVRKNGVPQDTTWAFLNLQPHFARRSLLAFIATRATFENHEPVVSRDSLAQRLLKTEPK